MMKIMPWSLPGKTPMILSMGMFTAWYDSENPEAEDGIILAIEIPIPIQMSLLIKHTTIRS